MPAFYTRPEAVEDIVTHIAARVLDQFGLELLGVPRWLGPQSTQVDVRARFRYPNLIDSAELSALTPTTVKL